MEFVSSYNELALLASLEGTGVAEYLSCHEFGNVFRMRGQNSGEHPGENDPRWCILMPAGKFEWILSDGTVRYEPETAMTMGSKVGTIARELGCETVSIPDGTTVLDNCAFNGCSGLKYAKIPDSVVRIGAFAFAGCGLEGVDIPYRTMEIGFGAFEDCTGLKSVAIPDSVTHLGEFAFCGCTRLERATIGNGVVEIGPSMFYNCSRLTSVRLPDSVERIGTSAFAGCASLERVRLGNRVGRIASGAFDCCVRLKEVVVPRSVEAILPDAFAGCKSLESVVFEGRTMDEVVSLGLHTWGADIPVKCTQHIV